MNAYMKQYPIRLNVRMEEELRDKAQKMAHKKGVSTSALFRLAMEKYLDDDEWYASQNKRIERYHNPKNL